MRRLIDADVLIKDLEEYNVDMSKAISEDELYINGYDAGLHTSICAVIEAVTVDAVEVVRCKDCKQFRLFLNKLGEIVTSEYGECKRTKFPTKSDGFCDLGKKVTE